MLIPSKTGRGGPGFRVRRCHASAERVGSAKTHDRGHAHGETKRHEEGRRERERERERRRRKRGRAREREQNPYSFARARSARPLRTHASALEAKELGGL